MTEFELRPYQKKDIAFMVAHKRVLNANEPGLGKTLETLTVINTISKGSTLIISPKIATGVWGYEASHWYGWDYIRITGEFKADERKAIREDFDRNPSRLLIINPAMLEEIQAWRSAWNTIVVDEAHLMGLLNPKSVSFALMQKMKCDNLFLLTGTPVRKGPQDLWPMLHLLNPLKFKAYWGFVNRYCHVIQGQFGKEILDKPKDPKAFKEMLDCYMVRNLKKNVLPELPDKQRQPIMVQMEGEQLRAYNEILNDMMLDTGDDLLLVSTRMTQDLRLRQLAVCPRILGIDSNGTALDALCDYLIPEEFACGRAVVIATPFRQAIPYIEQALKKALPKVTVDLIHGQMKETAQEVAQRFQERTNTNKILIYTIKSGASWTAHTASTGFMLGFEWSTTEQIQAEDRIHRLGQKNKVFWKYLLHDGTIDEAVMNKLDNKNMAIGWIMTPQEMYAKLEEIRNRNLNCPMKGKQNKV